MICLTACGLAAILSAAAWPATASAEAVTLSGAAGRTPKGPPEGFVYTTEDETRTPPPTRMARRGRGLRARTCLTRAGRLDPGGRGARPAGGVW